MKTYSSKSNAKRAAVKQGLEGFEVVQVEGGWAVVTAEVEAVPYYGDVQAEIAAELAFEEREVSVDYDAQVALNKELEPEMNEEEKELVAMCGHRYCPHCNIGLFNGLGRHGQIVNGTRILHEKFEFECLWCGQEFGAEINKTVRKAKKVNDIKIEKNREEQNGVRRPSLGGVCRAVWDACDAFLAENGNTPKPSNLKELAEKSGWNFNNVSIELYQWRKFNSISGRNK